MHPKYVGVQTRTHWFLPYFLRNVTKYLQKIFSFKNEICIAP